MIRFRHYIICFLIMGSTLVFAQTSKPIVLLNPSFEGYPHDAVTPDGWQEGGLDSSPDILPGPWGVYQKPTDGNTFLGLITRDNNSWEALGQKIPKGFKKDCNSNVTL